MRFILFQFGRFLSTLSLAVTLPIGLLLVLALALFGRHNAHPGNCGRFAE